MDPERLEFFRTLLQQRLQALLEGAGEAIGDLTGERENLSDSIDMASAESNRDFVLRLQDRDRRLIHKIRQALQRIDEEDYGVCMSCGSEINERRLMARPVATYCIDCKTEAEQMEHRRARV